MEFGEYSSSNKNKPYPTKQVNRDILSEKIRLASIYAMTQFFQGLNTSKKVTFKVTFKES